MTGAADLPLDLRRELARYVLPHLVAREDRELRERLARSGDRAELFTFAGSTPATFRAAVDAAGFTRTQASRFHASAPGDASRGALYLFHRPPHLDERDYEVFTGELARPLAIGGEALAETAASAIHVESDGPLDPKDERLRRLMDALNERSVPGAAALVRGHPASERFLRHPTMTGKTSGDDRAAQCAEMPNRSEGVRLRLIPTSVEAADLAPDALARLRAHVAASPAFRASPELDQARFARAPHVVLHYGERWRFDPPSGELAPAAWAHVRIRRNGGPKVAETRTFSVASRGRSITLLARLPYRDALAPPASALSAIAPDVADLLAALGRPERAS